MQALYRLHIGLHTRDGRDVTESELRRALDQVSRAWDAHTLIQANGVWRGEQEPALIVEAYQTHTDESESLARGLAELIAETLDQECVGLAILPGFAFELIEA